MAIESVEMWQNTSIIPDENLAHRMGLVPIYVDPKMFEFRAEDKPTDEMNSIRFKLHVECTKKDPKMTTPLNINDVEEDERFASCPPKPLHDDILIAKLRPGQEIEMELIC